MTGLKKLAELMAAHGAVCTINNNKRIVKFEASNPDDAKAMKLFFRKWADLLRSKGHKIVDVSSGSHAVEDFTFGFQLLGKKIRATDRKIYKILIKNKEGFAVPPLYSVFVE